MRSFLIWLLLIILLGALANTFMGLREANGVETSNALQVTVKTDGNFTIDWFSVHYTVGPDIKTYFSIDLNTSQEIAPFFSVDVPCDKVVYEEHKPIFDQAELTVWGSSFTENGITQDLTFNSEESYHSLFNVTIDNYPWGPDSYSTLYTYSFNLSQSIVEAKRVLAGLTDYSTAQQSNLRCIIGFEVDNLHQGISTSGQQRQLRFDLVAKTHALEHFSFDFSIPDGFYFVNKQTLDGEEMYTTPSSLLGIAKNDYGYDSQGNPFWTASAVVNWQVPAVAAFWETHPYDWVISAIVGLLISTALILVWNRLHKPKLLVSIVANPWIHPQLDIAFYRLIIENKGKSIAHDCRINIEFRDSKNQQLFSLVGKWDRLPEPLGPIEAGGWSKVWPALIPYAENLSVRPGDSESFCLVLKDNEDSCYAYNADSYLFNYKNPRWQLPIGEYFVDIEIKSENAKKCESFLVRNNGNKIQDVVISKMNSHRH